VRIEHDMLRTAIVVLEGRKDLLRIGEPRSCRYPAIVFFRLAGDDSRKKHLAEMSRQKNDMHFLFGL
jgi:hypothetical protein